MQIHLSDGILNAPLLLNHELDPYEQTMMYFIPGAGKKHNFPDHFGSIVNPYNKDIVTSTLRIQKGWKWICDNGAFTGKFQEDTFFAFLDRMAEYRSQCIFVVAPDVVGDANKTLEKFGKFATRIKALGYPVAFVAQDGQEDLEFPDNFDCLFIGGSTEWKMSYKAEICIKRAQALGKWVHVGRVNTRKRIRHFALLNIDSVDGTAIVFKPDERIRQIKRWTHETKQPLFYM